MKEIRIKIHSITGLISNSSTTVIMCVNTYTIKSITQFLDSIIVMVMPGKKAHDVFDISLEWDDVYIERLVESILEDAFQDESLPEEERENAGVNDYKDYPAIKAYVDSKLPGLLPEDPDEEGTYYDDGMEMATKYLCIKAKGGEEIPPYLAAHLYDLFTGEYISC